MSQPQDPSPFDETSTFPPAGRSSSFPDDTGETSTLRATPAPATSTQVTRGPSRGGSVLSSVLLSLVLTPLGLVALDYSISEGWGRGVTTLDNARVPVPALVALGVGAVLLLVVAGLSRMSGLGPLLAGLVWGAAPAVGFALVPVTTARRMVDLPDPYDQFLFGLTAQSMVFPAVGAVLIGAGLLGRWRRAKVVQPVTTRSSGTYAA
jgi:hypothetical protein